MPDILYILTLLLKQAGYNVQSIPEGASIVERKVDLPDLFILDKDMPLIDGLALCTYPCHYDFGLLQIEGKS